ncbi:hypothetical protein P43SY_005688 [Pythium insidiosum]|uniref:TATA element modulatory factor 1 TATA binding domain-containing protein n=1 Tax=Pythium insidiosum TaxID=114742 RepID=A0AAD5LHA0_PYTIN|nr:hypothetical protein P43SY_005688 [Pythium insidiosum]
MSWSAWSSRINVGSIVSQGLEQVSKLKEDVEKQFDQVVSGTPNGAASSSSSAAAAAVATADEEDSRLDLTKLEVPPPLPIPPAPLSERRSAGAVSRFNALNLPAPPRSADGKLTGRMGASAPTDDAFFASFLSTTDSQREGRASKSSGARDEGKTAAPVPAAAVDTAGKEDVGSEGEDKQETPLAADAKLQPSVGGDSGVGATIEHPQNGEMSTDERHGDGDAAAADAAAEGHTDEDAAPTEADSVPDADDACELRGDASAAPPAVDEENVETEEQELVLRQPTADVSAPGNTDSVASDQQEEDTDQDTSQCNGEDDDQAKEQEASGTQAQLLALQTALAQREAQLLSTSEMIQELHDELDKTCEREVAAVERNRLLTDQVELLRQEVVRLNRVAVAAQQASARDDEVAALQQAVAEKDEKLKALLDEGQALSVKQAQLEQRLRQLRREKNEEEEQKLKLQTQCDALSAQVAELSAALKTTKDDAKRSTQEARQLQQTLEQTSRHVASLEEELAAAKREASAWREQHDDVARQHRELEQEIEQHRDTSASHASLTAERTEMETTIAFLTQHVRDLEADAARRDELARLEAADLKKKWQDALHRVEALGHSVTDATQPLLRQIHALQEDQRGRQEAWNASEAALRQRAQELTAQRVALEHDKTELATQLQALQEQLAELHLVVHRREADVSRERERLEQSQQRERDARGRLEALQVELEELRLKYTDVRHAKDALATRLQQLQRDALEKDASGQRPVVSSEELEQLRRRGEQLEHDLNWHKQELQRVRRSPSTTSERDERATTGGSDGAAAPDSSAELTTQASILERSLLTSPVDGAPLSATSVLGVSQLQQRIRLREGENRLLRQQLQSLEAKQQASTEELVRLSTRNALLESNAATWQRTTEELEQLKQRQHVLLELFGEKEEQVEELQTEVAELKAFYRKQLDTLAQQQQ